MNFMDALTNNEKALTANGATMYKTSGSALVDINFMIPELRDSAINDDIMPYEKWMKAYNESPNYALRWLLYLRDVRCGLGERASFRSILLNIGKNDVELMLKILDNVPIAEFGRWDDIIVLLTLDNTEISKKVITIIALQLSQDLENMGNNKPISLLGKWLPSQNASSVETKKLGKMVGQLLKMSPRHYRKLLTKLRNYIHIVETNISTKDYASIDYEAVPSMANIKYRRAFLRNDTIRRQEFLEQVASGVKKINASVQSPHEIVNAYNNDRATITDDTLEEMWKKFHENISAEYVETLVVRDGSGSMCCPINRNSNCTALDVATAMAILCSEFNTGAYKDKFVTFSSMPEVVDLTSYSSLREKLRICSKYTDWTNTNLEATFDLILATGARNNLSQEELPQRVVVISDMQFD